MSIMNILSTSRRFNLDARYDDTGNRKAKNTVHVCVKSVVDEIVVASDQ
jgi:hypothetical protein